MMLSQLTTLPVPTHATVLVRMRDDAKEACMFKGPAAIADDFMGGIARTWAFSKKGRSARRLGNELFFYFSDRKLAGIAILDPLPHREDGAI